MNTPVEPHFDQETQMPGTAESGARKGIASPAVSVRRRGVLKAAVSAAPFVATLPSGEALAAASALQCVINEQTGAAEPPAPVVIAPVPPEDTYVRIVGEIRTYRSFVAAGSGGGGVGSIIVYKYTVDGDDILVVGQNTNPSAAPLGTWFNLGVVPAPILLSTQPAHFLRLYDASPNPITAPGDVAVDAGTQLPTACTQSSPNWPGPPTSPTGPSTADGKHCFYPVAVQANVNQAGNIPLTQSCLLSFS